MSTCREKWCRHSFSSDSAANSNVCGDNRNKVYQECTWKILCVCLYVCVGVFAVIHRLLRLVLGQQSVAITTLRRLVMTEDQMAEQVTATWTVQFRHTHTHTHRHSLLFILYFPLSQILYLSHFLSNSSSFPVSISFSLLTCQTLNVLSVCVCVCLWCVPAQPLQRMCHPLLKLGLGVN